MAPTHVTDVDFSWVINHGDKTIELDGDTLEDGSNVPGTDIKIHISKRNPWDKLGPEDKDKLIVASWAWDGLSFVGKQVNCKNFHVEK